MFNRSPFKFEFGVLVRDTVTGWEGKVTGRYEFINGCIRYGLETIKDGKHDEMSFDEGRLELVEAKDSPVTMKRTGGPRPTPSPSAGR
jgi:hypothetical protein